MNDPIVEEIRRIRDEHAARFDYDLDAIFRDIKARERQNGFVFVQGVARLSNGKDWTSKGAAIPNEVGAPN
jgi:hypothetical protein